MTSPKVVLTINNEEIIFAGNDIISANVIQDISPISIEVPACKAEINIYTTDERFSPFSRGSYYQGLKANTKVRLYEVTDTEEIFIGLFYLQNWDNPSENVLSFTLRDGIGVMDDVIFDGIFYENSTKLSEILSNLQIYSFTQIEAEASIADKELTGYIPGNISLREALQQVLFAAGAYAVTYGSEHILVKQPILPISGAVLVAATYDEASYYDSALYSDTVVQGTITNNDKTGNQKLTILPMVTSVELFTHDYYKSAIKETIFSDTLQPGTYKIIYEKPYGDVTAQGVGDVPDYLATEGGELLVTEDSGVYPNVTIIGKTGTFQFGSNSVSLIVINAGLVTIEGYPYIDNVQSISWSNPDAIQNYTEGALYDDAAAKYDIDGVVYQREWSIIASPNVWRIDSATMVNKNNGNEILSNLISIANSRHKQEIKALAHKETPPGLLYMVDSLYGEKIVAIAQSVKSDLSGGYLKDVQLVGVEKLEA